MHGGPKQLMGRSNPVALGAFNDSLHFFGPLFSGVGYQTLEFECPVRSFVFHSFSGN